MLKDIVPREYQKNIVNSILNRGNTLVILPTGLGKTLIGLMLIDRLKDRGQVLFMAPTRPLVEQHYNTILKHLDVNPNDVVVITGTIPKKKRQHLWEKRIIVATPQTVKNDLESGVFTLDGFSLCIIDEAHRAIGNYAYTYVASECLKNDVLILGLTASPGGDVERIKKILDTLGITNIEYRSRYDPDVKPYVKELKIRWVPVELEGEYLHAVKLLQGIVKKYIKLFRDWGFPIRYPSKKELVMIKQRIDKYTGNAKYTIISHYTTLFHLVHLQELLETQGVKPFLTYLAHLNNENTSKGVKRILRSKEINQIVSLLKGKEHPKLNKLLEIVQERKGEKIIIFVQYRDRLMDIVDILKKKGFRVQPFVGQRKGFTQEDQKRIIKEFRDGKFDILVATSIGEEGLDIPSVDTVIFYEPIPSEIRSIQRRGRAGRSKSGDVIILITKGTQDEAYYWSAIRREKKMLSIINKVRKILDNDIGKPKPRLDTSRSTSQTPKNLKTRSRKKESKQTKILDFI